MVGTLPVVQGIKLEQLTLLVGGMIAGCALLLVSDYLVLAGILLGFATIKTGFWYDHVFYLQNFRAAKLVESNAAHHAPLLRPTNK